MRRFKFSLETVRKVRAEHEEAAKQAFAAVQRERSQAQALLDWTAERLEQSVVARATGNRVGRVSVAQARAFEESRQAQLILLARCRAQLAEVDERLEQARAALIEAQRQLKVLEKLKERQWQAWKISAEREEQQQLDEQAQLSSALHGSAFGRTAEA